MSFPAFALRVTFASKFSIRWNVLLERSFMPSNSPVSSLERSLLLVRRAICNDNCEQIAADVWKVPSMSPMSHKYSLDIDKASSTESPVVWMRSMSSS